MQRTIFFADWPRLGMWNLTNFRWAFLPEPLVGICNRALRNMNTKVLIQMDICIPAATFVVVSIEPYESMLLVGEQMKRTFLGSILALGQGRPRDSHSKAILGDSHNRALGITIVET